MAGNHGRENGNGHISHWAWGLGHHRKYMYLQDSVSQGPGVWKSCAPWPLLEGDKNHSDHELLPVRAASRVPGTRLSALHALLQHV